MQKLISNDLHTFIASHYFSSNDIGVNEDVSNEYIPDDDRDAGGLPYCILTIYWYKGNAYSQFKC